VEPLAGPDPAVVFGAEHGYPLALKAAFGGGGRGMKVVWSADEVADALASAERESKAAFGRSEVYVERYLDAPRHVEAQILADRTGEVVFLGERDCSLQRRHQKLVEEAPAPGLPGDVRAALGKAACDIARAAGYENAGTIEFLYEPRTQQFYFLEMNTRLQVEHPVTELTAGLDLVHAQLRVAAGEPLPAGWDGLAPRGHAIEVRINAEDPGLNFLPAPGPITAWREPGGPGVRVDAGVRAGFTVPQAYDSLLAKLIVWGEDRDQARRRMLRALDEFQIEGVPTTIPFHRLAMQDPAFAAGEVSTVLVEQGMDLSSLEPAVLDPAGEPTAKPPPRRLVIELEGKRFDVDLFPQEPVKVPERTRTPRSPTALERARAESGGPGKEVVKTPMQGTIVKVLVANGDTVTPGQTLVVLEAMKMENHVTAHQAGTVSGVNVKEGDAVPTGATIATIEAT
jgi:acetyl-CoA/propionyl-CoA carboxylase biotin carboxyl carrier protein